MVRFISPEPAAITTRSEWERVADQCTSVEDLIERKHLDTARAVMGDALTLLPTGPRITDPSLLLQIWQVCLKLLSIDEKGKLNTACLNHFLGALRGRLLAVNVGSKHLDLLGWVEALHQVGRDEMKETIRIAIFKTAATLQEHIGDENVMVLSLWSLYCRKWAGSVQSRTALLAKLQYVWLHTQHLPVTETISIRYYYTYALHRMSSPGEEALVEQMASKLVADIECLPLPLEPKWDMRMLAFQVCTKLWAGYLQSQTKFLESRNQAGVPRNQTCKPHDQAREPLHIHDPADKPLRFGDIAGKSFHFSRQINNDLKTDIHLRRLCYCWIMTSAINTLERGDIVCQVAAASMAMTLGQWLDDQGDTHKVDWHGYGRQLLENLPKKTPPPRQKQISTINP